MYLFDQNKEIMQSDKKFVYPFYPPIDEDMQYIDKIDSYDIVYVKVTYSFLIKFRIINDFFFFYLFIYFPLKKKKRNIDHKIHNNNNTI